MSACEKVCSHAFGAYIISRGLSDGVMVAQSPLEALVMVRIHVGQPQIPAHLSF